MPQLRGYKLFISHAWDYKEEYYRLKEYLDSAPDFKWSDYSVPFHDPIDSNKAQEIKRKIDEQIRQSSVFIVLAGMWVEYHKWIQFEIDVAKKYKKPILGIKPWGHQRIPIEIQEAAGKIVGWNTSTIVEAIRELVK